jgi:hypothetical protein
VTELGDRQVWTAQIRAKFNDFFHGVLTFDNY